MAKRKPKDVGPALPHGLRADGGWVDRVAGDLAGADGGVATAVLDELARATPRPPADRWGAAEGRVERLCLSEPFGYQTVTPLTLGSDAYAAALPTAGPTDTWLAEWAATAERLGRDRVSAMVIAWLGAATSSGTGTLNRPGPNRDLLHVLCFATAAVAPAAAVDPLRRLAAHATVHRTPQSPTATIALGWIGTDAALGAVEQLAAGAKRPVARARYRRMADHLQARLGLDAAAAAERFVPTVGLDGDGRRRVTSDVGGGEVSVGLDGNVTVTWHTAAGKAAKAPPAALRAARPGDVRDLRATAKAASAQLTAQRQRLDRLMVTAADRSWAYADWARWYAGHPLVGPIARRLIWTFDGEPAVPAIATPTVRPDTVVRLWHPLGRPAGEVSAWRDRLAEAGVVQPFKQAHREVYPLTDAERVTGTYSNRFAGHVLRQHQFKELALGRGWLAELILVYDGGGGRMTATRDLPALGLTAEYWVEPPAGDDEATPAGAYLRVRTDRVRFRRGGEAVALADVPPLALSEVLRDVDLFVGVASVGNDPTWQDGGPGGRYRTYWHEYGFGDLSVTAQTRRAVLERLVPRLKIAGRCTLSERFLVVRGQVRTYKIHLGSGNILMEPNDQYLCIVAGRGGATDGEVFLPFEGDGTLSVILSKAFLLAADERITDPTITRQIDGA